ncbi:AraC family transcriptional regulator [Phaeacidiphilus oryzae]|uniref:AraC family transcriptional regulator n=1 Tax=Phaeacidiphilus oryzae TaxID=348818 RepID=UPI00068FAD52|nr:AraC family transcriptional regulator [Phaeacidiphilus oryzae]
MEANRERETARYWQHPAIPHTDLLSARYVRHTFGKHTHDTFVIAAVTRGVEEFAHAGEVLRVHPGELALVNPDVMHTGHAGVPEGWSYRVLYPEVSEVEAVAGELGLRRPGAGGLHATRTVVPDPALSELVLRVHAAAELDNALAASTAWRSVIVRLAQGYLAPLRASAPPGSAAGAGRLAAARARELLLSRMERPPSLDELAAEVGARPFPLLRVFRDAYGLPPHAWLTQERVRRARRLLDGGVRPAEAAVRVGFVDQAHLTRHFRRMLGVPPGAYAAGRLGPGRQGADPPP